jgi:hypothetical protein
MQKKSWILQNKISLVALAVPVAIIIVAFLPLCPFVQQALIGITLIWFYLFINSKFVSEYINRP